MPVPAVNYVELSFDAEAGLLKNDATILPRTQ